MLVSAVTTEELYTTINTKLKTNYAHLLSKQKPQVMLQKTKKNWAKRCNSSPLGTHSWSCTCGEEDFHIYELALKVSKSWLFTGIETISITSKKSFVQFCLPKFLAKNISSYIQIICHHALKTSPKIFITAGMFLCITAKALMTRRQINLLSI